MAQRWIWPYRRGKQNLETIGSKGYAILHDVGFSGDKLYYAGKVDGSGNFSKDWSVIDESNTRSRASVIKAIKRATRENPARRRTTMKKRKPTKRAKTRTVSLKNFTGKVRLNPDKTVSILGLGKKTKANPSRRKTKKRIKKLQAYGGYLAGRRNKVGAIKYRRTR